MVKIRSAIAIVILVTSAEAKALEFSSINELPAQNELREASQLVVSLERQIRMKPPGTTDLTGGQGTGFILRADPKTRIAWIMTAAHCVYCQGGLCSISVKGIFGDAIADSKTIKMDLQKDIALFQIKLPKNFKTTIQTPFSPAGNLGPKEQALWYGFPKLTLRPDQNWVLPRPKDYKKTGLRFSDGRFLSFTTRFPLQSQMLGKWSYQKMVLLEGDALPGNSGGPIFNSKGEVIGMMIQIYGSGAATNYQYCAGLNSDCYQLGISSEAIVEFMQTSL